ncbi:MAG: carboxynorspermidine decarboxylase [Bacillota bacterium]|nr:carboxynorspermidine decarboxylase [Bacillota bacterium]
MPADKLVRTPCYIVDEQALEDNLRILASVSKQAGCKILLAQKAFSMYAVYPLISRYLDGTTASGLYEAKLGHEFFGKETHVFSPAYTDEEFADILAVSDHLVFNSFTQWRQFGSRALQAGKTCGMRVNPEKPTQAHTLYDPCTPASRLGVTRDQFCPDQLDGLSGLHFHCLCEQNVDALEAVLAAFEEKFGAYLAQMSWVNFGGGHHITRPDYDRKKLVDLIRRFKAKYDVTVYLEPGEAVALNAGYLVATVIDLMTNGMPIAILDTSATCHMPDILEMPYRPQIIGAGAAGEKPHLYRLGGPTCLAGDIIGDYAFDQPLRIGDQLVFCDMAIYTMVKNNTFNGMRLPSITLWHKNDTIEVIRQFGYEDFKNRLS